MKILAMLLLLTASYTAQVAVPAGTCDPNAMTIAFPAYVDGSLAFWVDTGLGPNSGSELNLVWNGATTCDVRNGFTYVFLFIGPSVNWGQSALGPIISQGPPVVMWILDTVQLFPFPNPTGFVPTWAPTGQTTFATPVDITIGGQSLWQNIPGGITFSMESAWFVPDTIGGYHGFLGLPVTVTT